MFAFLPDMMTQQNRRLYAALRTRFGLEEFRPLQLDVIRDVLAGGTRFVVFPTGGGKSLCYLLPAPLLSGPTLVVSPLIALIADQLERARRAGIKAVAVGPGTGARELAHAEVIFTSPERLLGGGLLGRLARQGRIAHLVLDEAHCVTGWGSTFRPFYGELGEAICRLAPRAVSLFTASANEAERSAIAARLGLPEPKTFVAGFDRPNIAYHAARTPQPLLFAARYLAKRRGKAIIYCRTRRMAEDCALYLEKAGIVAAPFHAGMSPARRAMLQRRFAGGRLRVLAATSAFGMGVDVPDVRIVIHLSLPASIDAFFQESGRAGRDGRRALSLVLLDTDPGAVAIGRHGETPGALLAAAAGQLPARPVPEEVLAGILGGIGGDAFAVPVLQAALYSAGIYQRRCPGRRVEAVPVDGLAAALTGLARRQQRESAAAAAAVAAVFSTAGCLRTALLAHYGETPGDCGGCDHCGSSEAEGLVEEREAVARIDRLAGRLARMRWHEERRVYRESGIGERGLALLAQAVETRRRAAGSA